jgi:hypothetical protein
MTTKTLDEWLRDAHRDPEAGCPPPEAFLEAEAGALFPEERQRLDEHAARCPACAAERDLARLFDAAPEEAGVRPEDLDFVVSRLGEASPVRPVRPKVVPFPGPRREVASRSRSRSWVRFAAAAVLVMAAGLGYQAFQVPEPALPEPEIGGVVRGGEVEAVSPLGEVAEMPGELRWVPLDGAASYRVQLTAVDGAVLWEGTALAPSLRLPAEVAGRLHRAVVYTWTVEALGPAGERLASSGPVTFKAKPDGL